MMSHVHLTSINENPEFHNTETSNNNVNIGGGEIMSTLKMQLKKGDGLHMTTGNSNNGIHNNSSHSTLKVLQERE